MCFKALLGKKKDCYLVKIAILFWWRRRDSNHRDPYKSHPNGRLFCHSEPAKNPFLPPSVEYIHYLALVDEFRVVSLPSAHIRPAPRATDIRLVRFTPAIAADIFCSRKKMFFFCPISHYCSSLSLRGAIYRDPAVLNEACFRPTGDTEAR